ncbi:hypothetical protein BH24ACT5_BH24ACT5_28550 [soil metagenome]
MFAVIAVVVVGFIAVNRAMENQRQARAMAIAAAAGLTADLGTDSEPHLPFDVFSRGHGRTVRYRMCAPGTRDSVFGYEYTTGSGKSQRLHRLTCAHLAVPFSAPQTAIGPEGFWSGVGRLIGIDDIEVESSRFNDEYRVTGIDERFAVTLLDPLLIAWMIGDHGGIGRVRLELQGTDALCLVDRLDIEQYPAFLRFAQSLRSRFPTVLQSLYPASR